jgi:hypothetical protein
MERRQHRSTCALGDNDLAGSRIELALAPGRQCPTPRRKPRQDSIAMHAINRAQRQTERITPGPAGTSNA